MREEPLYKVREAILVKRPEVRGGSVWALTFTPLASPESVPFDPEGVKEIVVTVMTDRIDNMSFSTPYTHEEIMALRETDPQT
jgi:hypothetical protein